MLKKPHKNVTGKRKNYQYKSTKPQASAKGQGNKIFKSFNFQPIFVGLSQ